MTSRRPFHLLRISFPGRPFLYNSSQVIICRILEKVDQVFPVVCWAAEQRGAHLQCGQSPPARGEARRHLRHPGLPRGAPPWHSHALHGRWGWKCALQKTTLQNRVGIVQLFQAMTLSLIILITEPITVTKNNASLMIFFINNKAFGVTKRFIVDMFPLTMKFLVTPKAFIVGEKCQH